MEHDHSPEAISRRLAGSPRQNYLRDWVYGGIDGSVTTFAVVAGVVGAGLSARNGSHPRGRQSAGRWFFHGRQQL